MARFFTSDTHFGHAKAIEHGRPFGSVEEMEEAIVERWNRVVGDDDTIYHLGDFAMGPRDKTIPRFARRLRGYKILICGNHDHIGHLAKEKFHKPPHSLVFEPLYRSVFQEIHNDLVLPVAGTFVHMAHLPFVGDHKGIEPRFMDKRPKPDGLPLLHGHVHDEWLVREEPNLPLMINVGVDMWNFTPVSEEELEKWLK